VEAAVCNSHLLNLLGVPAERIGDSTGQFKELSGRVADAAT